MSDTPRTDEQINGKPCTQFGLLAGMSLRNALVPSEFARQLERELADANEWKNTLNLFGPSPDIVANEISRLRAELAATKHLLHESLQREDRFYRELVAAKAEIAVLRFDQEVHQSWFGSK